MESEMNNQEKLVNCYTDILDTLGDITAMIYDTEDFEQLDDLMEVADKLSVILKRVGETQILENLEQDLEIGGDDE